MGLGDAGWAKTDLDVDLEILTASLPPTTIALELSLTPFPDS